MLKNLTQGPAHTTHLQLAKTQRRLRVRRLITAAFSDGSDRKPPYTDLRINHVNALAIAYVHYSQEYNQFL